MAIKLKYKEYKACMNVCLIQSFVTKRSYMICQTSCSTAGKKYFWLFENFCYNNWKYVCNNHDPEILTENIEEIFAYIATKEDKNVYDMNDQEVYQMTLRSVRSYIKNYWHAYFEEPHRYFNCTGMALINLLENL